MIGQKVKAFTVMEVTITMLVTAILIGITYTSYSIIVKSYLSFNSKNSELADLNMLDHLLKRDFNRANIIKKESNGISLKADSQMIRYEFNGRYIVRVSSKPDTIKIETQNIVTNFKGNPISELQQDDEQNRIDELIFTVLYKDEKIPYHYYKLYSSQDLFQRNF